MITLGIETSCDETGVSVIKDGKILSNEVASSLKFHRRYGGIVPEIATRHHTQTIDRVFKKAILNARLKEDQIDLIAFTYGPGLAGALLVGVSFAKALGFSLRVPILGINHLQAHTFSAFIGKRIVPYPFISLIISGGHTCLALIRDLDEFKLLGQTADDAMGEAFDKVSKILGFGYPGGPIIEALARKGNPERVKLTYTNRNSNSLNFSFSGIKTAVLYYVKDTLEENKRINPYDVASSFQETLIKMVFEKVRLACEIKKVRNVVVGGGVSINRRLREYFTSASRRHNLRIIFPEKSLCLDNAGMVAALGEQLYKRKKYVSDYYISSVSNLGFDKR